MISVVAATAVSCSVPAPQRGRDGLGLFDAFDQHVDAVAAPEQFAVEHHGGYPEHAEGFRLVDDAVVFLARRTADVGFEILWRTADVSDHTGNVGQFVDFEVVTPEASEHHVMVTAK